MHLPCSIFYCDSKNDFMVSLLKLFLKIKCVLNYFLGDFHKFHEVLDEYGLQIPTFLCVASNMCFILSNVFFTRMALEQLRHDCIFMFRKNSKRFNKRTMYLTLND